MLRIDVVTIFPEYLEPLRTSLTGRATARGLLEVGVHDLRGWATDVHRSVDDRPCGGGPGMVMKPEVWGPALDDVLGPGPAAGGDDPLLVVPGPAGERFTQAHAERLAGEARLVFACGRYEGIDQRVLDDAARRVRVLEVSLGDYVLIGGEVAVLAVAEAVVRLLPGVLGNPSSHREDSFSGDSVGLLEGPAYTRPVAWRGLEVPDVLLSGDHARIAAWRLEQSRRRTRERRPDLLG